ncbi:putative metal-dependent hydrolase [Paenibacillus albidus]|uniref:Metal-dependent hydrolase n=1 Tax=Paenibacillus albidus TaxID=2041023 RepID=A0A917CLV1_9BACL|nr:putative metal-dependent hydrolase [Paenibacillus albidus]GGF92212.1 putative metal-dependent hydrolase [Paenibacillus albidus]
MDLWSYPIGRFVPEEQPNSGLRQLWIQDIAALPAELRAAVSNLDEEQQCAPYRPGGWTIRQVVHHLADNDMNAYIRFKRALTEDKPVSSSYREDLWAELSDYQETPVECSIMLMEALHKRFVILLRSLSPSDFQRSFVSPTHGSMTLDHAIQRYAWHGRHHLSQIESLIKRMGW